MSSNTIGEAPVKSVDKLLGTGAQLSTYMDGLLEVFEEDSPERQHYTVTWGRLLAERLNTREDGVKPLAYAMATSLLISDCIGGFDGTVSCDLPKPMPADVTGLSQNQYNELYLLSYELALGTFGEEFASELDGVFLSFVNSEE